MIYSVLIVDGFQYAGDEDGAIVLYKYLLYCSCQQMVLVV